MIQYNVETLTIEELAVLIASGNDSKRNQIRIKEDGTIFLSTIVGAQDLEGIKGRFETFESNNGYVGEKAASNQAYIKQLFLTIQNWLAHPKPFIDVWVTI